MRRVYVNLIINLVALLVCMPIHAYDFHSGEFYYTILENGKDVAIVSGSNGVPGFYNGVISIPETVKYNGNTYNVTTIRGGFWDSDITSIAIPRSITSISNDGFEDSRVGSVHISDLEAWCKIDFEGLYANPLYLGSSLFLNGQVINDLVIPNSLTSIGSYTFSGCHLSSVTIPESVTSIGTYAFRNCSMTSITIPNSVTTIEDHAFSGCSGLTSITIPNRLTNIEDYSFYGCSGLTSVSIPNSVTSIGSSAFSGCSSLNSIKVETANSKFDSRNNCNAIIETELNTIIVGCKNTTIPNSVTSIGSQAFYGCSGLTSITIPNSVMSIGNSAFKYCIGLTSVTIPNSVTSIGGSAFYYCSGMTSITIPNSVTSIESYAFYGCSGLTSITIPNNVTSIGSSAFYGCSGLTSITIPNNVTSIGGFAFDGTAWYNNQPDGIVYAGKVAYKYKGEMPANTSLSIKDGTLGVAENAFYSCKSLIYITIPNSVTGIGSSAFSNCSGLTSVTIPNSVTSIGSSAFDGTAWYNNQPDGLVYAGKVAYKYKGEMPANTSISIKEGTLGIAGSAFSSCSGLTSITIPNSVTSIESYTFLGCSGLTSVTIPNSVASIGWQAFSYCCGLTSITIPNSVTSIGGSAFSYCSGLTSITIPNSVTSIEDYAFNGCKSLTTIISEIEKPFIIDSNTFSDDTYIVAELIVPFGKRSAYQATGGWNKFTMVTEAEDKDEALFTIDGISYQGTKLAKSVVVTSVDKSLTSLEIHASVRYDGTDYQVTGIADNAFDGCNMGALIWDLEVALPNNAFSNATIGSNFLLYVKSASYAPSSIKNVVVNGTASSIVLSGDDDGGQFYCPQAFTARKISYTHNYSMETGGNGKGWETLVLPFDVQKISHSTRGEIVPFPAYSSSSNLKPFWLANFSGSGFRRTSAVLANEPYIIAMPNSSNYNNNYNLAGDVTFSAENVEVPKTPLFSGTFLPTYATVAKSSTVYALNVDNRHVKYSGSYDAGSRFISNLRDIRPFEAYIYTNSTRGIFEINLDDGATDMENILFFADEYSEITIHTLSGQLVGRTTQRDFNKTWNSLSKGVYIINGKKLIK